MNGLAYTSFATKASMSSIRRVVFLLLFSTCASVALSADTSPDPAVDTLSPAYDWSTLPYSWAEIKAGDLPVSPVHWKRHASNPVVGRGMNCRPVVWNENTVRVFFGRRGRGGGICYFDVDPKEPGKIRGQVVGPIITTGEKGSYDDDWVIAPELVRLSTTHWRMYYSAKQSGRSFFQQAWSLAMAETHDAGETWTKHQGNPILTTGKAEWEQGAVGFCSVEQTDEGFRMWYLGTNTAQNAVKQVGLATSKDGVVWDRSDQNPVIAVRPDFVWEKGAIAVPRVIRDGKLLKVWYCSYPQNNTYAIGQAASVDGVHWRRSAHNPVLRKSGTGWDSSMTAYPGVVRVGDQYLMWYSGNSYGGAGIGLATAPAPQGKWLYRTGPTETPNKEWSAWSKLEEAPVKEGCIQFAILKAKRDNISADEP